MCTILATVAPGVCPLTHLLYLTQPHLPEPCLYPELKPGSPHCLDLPLNPEPGLTLLGSMPESGLATLSLSLSLSVPGCSSDLSSFHQHPRAWRDMPFCTHMNMEALHNTCSGSPHIHLSPFRQQRLSGWAGWGQINTRQSLDSGMHQSSMCT